MRGRVSGNISAANNESNWRIELSFPLTRPVTAAYVMACGV
jgi:hypothetical protein